MPPLEVLEVVLAACAACNKVVGVGPADATAESDIQSPGGLVDEIVHVGLMAAVVIAREQHAALVINKDPPREMNGLHTRQIAASEYVTRGELDDRKDECDRGAAKCSGLR